MWSKIRWWFKLHFSKINCDMCNDTFNLGEMTAISGDWWLCDKCFEKYIEDAKGVLDG